LLVYSHFFGFFIFLIQGISVLTIPEYRKTILKYYAQSVAISCIAYIPYFPVFFSRFFRSAVGGTWVEPPVVSDLYTMVWRYLNAPVVTVAVLCILALALVKFIAGIRRGNSYHRHTQLVLVIWFLVPYLIMFLVSFKIPMFLDRYTVFISIGFYLLVAVAINSLAIRAKITWIFILVFIFMMAVTFHPRADNRQRIKDMVRFITINKGPNTDIVICPQWSEYGFSYYYNQAMFGNYKRLRQLLNRDGIFPVNDISDLDTLKMKEADQIFFVEEWVSLTDPGQTLFNYLGREFKYEKTITFYKNIKVHQYLK
jgi:mannosyltransferase